MNISKNIFLVEDDEDDQIFFTECIDEIENADLIGASSNGDEALRKLESIHVLPDIIFMDINMPFMNGLECLAEIIKHPRLKNIPVIMLSTDTTQAGLAQKLGAKAFLKKSSDCQSLKTKMEELINRNFGSDDSFECRTFHFSILNNVHNVNSDALAFIG